MSESFKDDRIGPGIPEAIKEIEYQKRNRDQDGTIMKLNLRVQILRERLAEAEKVIELLKAPNQVEVKLLTAVIDEHNNVLKLKEQVGALKTLIKDLQYTGYDVPTESKTCIGCGAYKGSECDYNCCIKVAL